VTSSKFPVTGVPPPILILNKPKEFVVAVWVSEYWVGPDSEPNKMEILTLTL
jgi:hypothetical protein